MSNSVRPHRRQPIRLPRSWDSPGKNRDNLFARDGTCFVDLPHEHTICARHRALGSEGPTFSLVPCFHCLEILNSFEKGTLQFHFCTRPRIYAIDSGCVCVLSHSVMSDSATPWTAPLQAPLSVGFPRQEYWSGLPFSAPRDLPDTGINTRLLHWQAGSLLLSHLGSPSARCGLSQ